MIDSITRLHAKKRFYVVSGFALATSTRVIERKATIPIIAARKRAEVPTVPIPKPPSTLG